MSLETINLFRRVTLVSLGEGGEGDGDLTGTDLIFLCFAYIFKPKTPENFKTNLEDSFPLH